MPRADSSASRPGARDPVVVAHLDEAALRMVQREALERQLAAFYAVQSAQRRPAPGGRRP